jgi:ABC-2 type transport system permease protein
MPTWLKWVASLNPLSFAIEPIRHVYLNQDWSWASVVMHAPWGEVSLGAAVLFLLVFDGLALLSAQRLLQRKLG